MIAPKIRTCRSDDANAPSRALDKCEVYKRSWPSILVSTTISIWNATFTHAPISNSTEPQLLPNGVNFVRHMGQRRCPFADWFAFV